MQYAQQQSPQHRLTPAVTAKLIATNALLQLSSLELDRAITDEACENPAFDVEEAPHCPRCGMPLSNSFCSMCGSSADAMMHSAKSIDVAGVGFPAAWSAEDDESEALASIEDVPSLSERLMQTLGAVVATRDLPIAEVVVGSLDEHGYLAATIAEIAEQIKEPEARVAAVLEILQAQEPPGIGARDLRECLLLQLRWLREQGHPYPLAEQIVAGYLREIGARRIVEVAAALGATVAQVKQAWQLIRTKLLPFPASAVAASDAYGSSEIAVVRPDVVFRRTDSGFEAEIVESRRYFFAINPGYRTVAQARDRIGVSEEDLRHISRYIKRARFFIDNVHQRWAMLERVANALIEVHYDFFDKGVRWLKPLTRSELAVQLGVHETTVSRATRDKYALLPSGRIASFDDFFDASLRAKAILRELIASEDPHRPLSDERLAAMLAGQGVPVARRTVAKYRETLGILPARLRPS